MITISDDYRADILRRARAYCQRTGCTPAMIGKELVKDSKFVRRIESGGTITVDTYIGIMRWFERHGVDSAAGMSAAKKRRNRRVETVTECER